MFHAEKQIERGSMSLFLLHMQVSLQVRSETGFLCTSAALERIGFKELTLQHSFPLGHKFDTFKAGCFFYIATQKHELFCTGLVLRY